MAVVDTFAAACNAHDLEGALACCTEDLVFEGTTPPDGVRAVGRAAVRSIWEPIFANLDTQVDVEETFVAEGRVVQRCRYSWGDGHVRAVDIYRIEHDLIAEKLSYVKG